MKHLLYNNGFHCFMVEDKQQFLILLMDFSVVPKGPPVIANIDQVFFKLGDWLNLNCTSKPSRPPTRLTWLVNGVEVIYHTL